MYVLHSQANTTDFHFEYSIVLLGIEENDSIGLPSIEMGHVVQKTVALTILRKKVYNYQFCIYCTLLFSDYELRMRLRI